MSDEMDADCDDLPPVAVPCSARDKGRFLMPPAGEVAAGRARAERAEAALRRLREPAPAPPAHSDSSGSEGEAALAASVSALAVRAAPAGRERAPPLAALLCAAAPLLPAQPLLATYPCAALPAPPAPAPRLAAATLSRLASSGRRGARAERAAVAAWLCLALAAAERRRLAAPLAQRATHAAVEDGAAEALAASLLLAVPAPAARVRLADALRGAGAPCSSLADTLESDARRELAAAAGQRALTPAERCAALRLRARARARGAPPGGGREGRGARARGLHPDSLQVRAAATKLQMLFPDDH